MVDDTFDALINRHLMGQAYKQITSTMGPSPQLVAFVNYENATSNNFGLESMNIMDQHTQILADIDADPALENALKIVHEELDNALTGWNVTKTEPAMEGLLSRIFSKGVNEYKVFENFKLFHDHTIDYIESILNKVPKKFDLKTWTAFEKHVEETQQTYFDKLDSSVEPYLDVNKSFEKSGWTESNYKSAVEWADKATAQSDRIVALHKEKLEEVKKSIDDKANKDNPDYGKIVALMNKTVKLFYGMDSEGAGSADQAKALLAKVGKHFK